MQVPILKQGAYLIATVQSALTDEDLDLIGGNRATLVSVLTEKYAYTEEQAQKQVEEFIAQATARTHA